MTKREPKPHEVKLSKWMTEHTALHLSLLRQTTAGAVEAGLSPSIAMESSLRLLEHEIRTLNGCVVVAVSGLCDVAETYKNQSASTMANEYLDEAMEMLREATGDL